MVLQHVPKDRRSIFEVVLQSTIVLWQSITQTYVLRKRMGKTQQGGLC